MPTRLFLKDVLKRLLADTTAVLPFSCYSRIKLLVNVSHISFAALDHDLRFDRWRAPPTIDQPLGLVTRPVTLDDMDRTVVLHGTAITNKRDDWKA